MGSIALHRVAPKAVSWCVCYLLQLWLNDCCFVVRTAIPRTGIVITATIVVNSLYCWMLCVSIWWTCPATVIILHTVYRCLLDYWLLVKVVTVCACPESFTVTAWTYTRSVYLLYRWMLGISKEWTRLTLPIPITPVMTGSFGCLHAVTTRCCADKN